MLKDTSGHLLYTDRRASFSRRQSKNSGEKGSLGLNTLNAMLMARRLVEVALDRKDGTLGHSLRSS